MADNEFMSMRELADKLKMDRSHARRYVINLGYKCHKRRTQDSAGQLALCVTTAEAEEIINRRKAQGFIESDVPVVSDVGMFYVIQLVPELDPKRLKLGFADSIGQRLSQHRTAAPTAKVLHAWPCKRSWELTVMDSLTRLNCRRILNEVFEGDDPTALVERGETLFSLLPHPSMRIPLAETSPLISVDQCDD